MTREWRKSSFSNGGDNCVEVGANAGAVGVRDSKDRSRPPLVFSRDQWAAFLSGAKTGEFDLGTDEVDLLLRLEGTLSDAEAAEMRSRVDDLRLVDIPQT